MAEDEDQESRTEEATEKRITDAIEKGNVPVAREVTLFGSLAATFAGLWFFSDWMVARLTETLRSAFSASGYVRIVDRQSAASYTVGLLRDCGLPLLAVLAIIAAGSLVASVLQNSPSAASERVQPKISRLSLFTGWTRLFGKAGLVEFAKSVVKFGAVCAILWFHIKGELPGFFAALTIEPRLLPAALRDMISSILIPLLVLSMFLALADLVWSRLRWRRDLRMTKQEIKEEMKEAEGDPFLKSRLRSLARQRNSRRMLEKLPEASMVITNPTHYAVALRYRREDGGAPTVVAKGVDHMAQKIREIAMEHEVPLVENRPLARSLYDQVEIDAQIPPEFYRAVAEIIHYLNNTRRLPRGSRYH